MESILGNIREYHQAHNATIILVSHSMEEVARSVDRLVAVNDGRIPFQGPPREVFQHGEELERMGLGSPSSPGCSTACGPWGWTSTPRSTPWSRPKRPFWPN